MEGEVSKFFFNQILLGMLVKSTRTLLPIKREQRLPYRVEEKLFPAINLIVNLK